MPTEIEKCEYIIKECEANIQKWMTLLAYTTRRRDRLQDPEDPVAIGIKEDSYAKIAAEASATTVPAYKDLDNIEVAKEEFTEEAIEKPLGERIIK